jgi:hypothetical protein
VYGLPGEWPETRGNEQKPGQQLRAVSGAPSSMPVFSAR